MTYISLIPLDRRFLEEHMTLVWMGNTTPYLAQRAEYLVKLINAYMSDVRSTEDVVPLTLKIYSTHCYRNFGGTMVAVGEVSTPVQEFRDLADMVGLNASEFDKWQPHITGRNGAWRLPGEEVIFSHAELVGLK